MTLKAQPNRRHSRAVISKAQPKKLGIYCVYEASAEQSMVFSVLENPQPSKYDISGISSLQLFFLIASSIQYLIFIASRRVVAEFVSPVLVCTLEAAFQFFPVLPLCSGAPVFIFHLFFCRPLNLS